MISPGTRWIQALALVVAAHFSTELMAQDPVPDDASTGVTEEGLFELIDDEEISANIAELLAWFHENPIDLNTAGREDLLAIPGMTGEDADAILRARENAGQFASVEDLRGIPRGEEVLTRIRPYVIVHVTEPATRHARVPVVVLSSRFSRSLAGTAAQLDPAMLGGLTKTLWRLTLNLSDHVKMGGLFEKDAGERASDGFPSGYILFRGGGTLEQFVLGDFTVGAGQGLVLWRGSDFGRSGDVVTGVRKSGSHLQPYHLTDEAHYLRGGAISLKIRPFAFPVRCMLMVSRTGLSANVNDQGVVTSFYSTGLYRTASEIGKRNLVHEFLAGTRLECGTRGKGTIGITFYGSAFDKPVEPNSGFGFSGQRSDAAGGDFSLPLGPGTLFGECARTGAGGTAWIAGGVLAIDSTVKVSVAYRDYSKNFNNPHARGFGVQGNTTNERGISIGWLFTLPPNLEVRGYADQCKMPGASYTSLLPRSASDFLVEIAASPGLVMRLSLAFRLRKSEVMQPGSSIRSTDVQSDRNKTNMKLAARMKISSRLTTRTRIERGASQSSITKQLERGVMGSQTLCYDDGGIACEYGVAFFQADSYDARLYDFEGNLHGSVPSPPLYGRGSRWHLVFSWASLPFLRIAGKYAVTLRERNPSAREIAFQAELRL